MNAALTEYDPALPGAEAVKYLGLGHVESLRRLVRKGILVAIREPGTRSTLRVRLSELNRYLASRATIKATA